MLKKTLSIILLIFGLYARGQDTPGILEFYSLLGQDIETTSAFLTKHKFILSDTSLQGKANRTCCPDINFKKKRFYAIYYSNGQTEVELIVRNDNKLYSIELIFPLKNNKYMQASESELKSLSFQVVESKRNHKEKTSYKQLRNNAILSRRAFLYYFGSDRPDTIIIDDTKFIKEK